LQQGEDEQMKLPDLERPIRLVGLTGSMGSGKSSAARAFAALSVPVVDANEPRRVGFLV
jgi:putative protein kinase ArgK-like GTPase of G3E family